MLKTAATPLRQPPRKTAGHAKPRRYPPPTEAEIRDGIRCGPDCPMPHIPNAETVAAMRETERGENLTRCENYAEFRKHLKSAGLL